MEAQIAQMIDSEVERRLADKLDTVLSYISKTYDVSMKQLLRDTASLKVAPDVTCLGLTAKKQRCKMRAHCDTGYCKHHKDQKPLIHRHATPPIDMDVANILAGMKHNHPSTILFSENCPGCKKKPRVALKIDI